MKQGYIAVRPELEDVTMDAFRKAGERPLSRGLSGAIINVSLHGEGAIRGREQSDFRKRMEGLEIYHKKAVPEAYTRGSISQRLALVQGLMDTDGYIDANGTAIFSNTNEGIIDPFREVLRTLGYASTKVPWLNTGVGAKGPYKQGWKTTFRPIPSMNPFRLRDAEKVQEARYRSRLAGRITSIEQVESVPVRCIAVSDPDHLFLAGESMVPTHNCHRVPKAVEEVLYSVLEDSTLYTVMGRTVVIRWRTWKRWSRMQPGT